ncbi:MAG: hypothetical protein A3H97_15510 [Acidobacteria bacterium RIFCSPLOWO2_02_FULL_65_29]|nr:MAG: hypothetical protein A3H97_15510 [Acidobacteria bacterium RIFCSPLOWO2_02_FULL_65_29]
MNLDVSKWSGEGAFTQALIDHLQQLKAVELVRVEDAPASRSEADYNFISNEIFVKFAVVSRQEPGRRFGVLPMTRVVSDKAMTMEGLEQALAAMSAIGACDYADESMLQYLRTERIIPPYQTRGYKLVELVRVYEMGALKPGVKA